MIALRSYTQPRERDLRMYRTGQILSTAALLVAVCAGGLVIAHVTLNTLAALPTLTAPMPGCC